MRNIYKFAIVAIVAAIALANFAIQPTAFDRENATPKPATPVWETERDLIVLFENSDDRVALALQIRDTSLDLGNGLSPQQRYDGLAIAGHTLYRERELEEAVECFDGIIALNHSDDSTADAARMNAQSYMLLARFDDAVMSFQLCDAVSRQIEIAQGYHDLYRSNILGYLEAAYLSQDHPLVVSLVDEIMAQSEKYQLSDLDVRIVALKTAANSARQADMDLQAASYLTTLLETFPDYGTDFPGERAKIVMDRLDDQGHSLSDRDPLAVEAAMAIVQDSSYFGMPVWAHYVDQSAKILDEIDETESANDLRLWAVDRLQEKSDALPVNDLYINQKREAIKKNQADLIYRTAYMKQKAKQTLTAASLYQTLIDDYSDVAPDYAQDANRQIQGMQPLP